MIATITTKRFRLSFETGEAEPEGEDETSLVSNVDGDFDPAPEADAYQGSARFGFSNWRQPRAGGYQLTTARAEPSTPPAGRAGSAAAPRGCRNG